MHCKVLGIVCILLSESPLLCLKIVVFRQPNFREMVQKQFGLLKLDCMWVDQKVLKLFTYFFKAKKKLCLFPVTCLKILGLVSWKSLFFLFFFFFLKSHDQTFFPTNFASFTSK